MNEIRCCICWIGTSTKRHHLSESIRMVFTPFLIDSSTCFHHQFLHQEASPHTIHFRTCSECMESGPSLWSFVSDFSLEHCAFVISHLKDFVVRMTSNRFTGRIISLWLGDNQGRFNFKKLHQHEFNHFRQWLCQRYFDIYHIEYTTHFLIC